MVSSSNGLFNTDQFNTGTQLMLLGTHAGGVVLAGFMSYDVTVYLVLYSDVLF
jgi:hypothetical protein